MASPSFGEGHAGGAYIMQRKTSSLRAFAWFGALACAMSAAAVPAEGTPASRHTSRSCAVAHGASSSATSASASSHSSTTAARHEHATRVARDMSARSGSMSSSMTSSPNGLAGTTTMPDGSTVTIVPGQGVENPPPVKSGSSANSASASAAVGASKDDDCVDPGTGRHLHSREKHQYGNRPQSQQENRK